MTAKKNILIALMLLLLVAASACALTACNGIPTDIGAQIATDDVGNPMYGGETYVMPEGMAFSASASSAADTDTSVTLTANYEPAGTTNQQTNWSVSFANPSSSWATGKTVTDYVTVTSTGINTAEVKCLQAFGEQIIVTATSAVDSSVSDTTTVDFEKKFLDVKFTLYRNSTELGSALNSELEAGVTSEYFDYAYVENNHSVITTYPYRRITAKIDSTGDTGDTYRVAVTPVFSDYTVDKTFGEVYEFSGATTMHGEQFEAISGTENYAVPSDRFTAPGYWSWGYSDNERVNDLILEAINYTADTPNALDFLALLSDVTLFENAVEDGTITSETQGATVAAALVQAFREVYPAGQVSQEVIDNIYNTLKPYTALIGAPTYVYDDSALDLGNYETAEDYFANKAAKTCTRITFGFHGTGFQIVFRFNADSL